MKIVKTSREDMEAGADLIFEELERIAGEEKSFPDKYRAISIGKSFFNLPSDLLECYNTMFHK